MLSLQEFIDLQEHVLSIGINPSHEKYREKHRQEMHDMIHKSYAAIGGYAGHETGSDKESEAIYNDIDNSLIKAVKRNGKLTAINLYKKQHGRKSIASATDGSDQGKEDFKKSKLEDHEQRRAWGEVSGAPEHIQRKMGVPIVSNKRARELLNKDVDLDDDGEHYSRKIGGHVHRKVIMGHPKKEI